MQIARASLFASLLLAGCGFAGGGYPSLKPRAGEAPRIITAPGEGLEAGLSPEERSELSADLAREGAALDAVERDIAAARTELEGALGAAGAAKPGSEAWSAAQMSLSRYDLARSPLDEIDARLSPLLRQVDSLSVDHPDRQAVESLVAAVARTGAEAERQVQAANRRLGGGA